MGGRVKTLHPKILGGILALLPEHEEEMHANGIVPIDLVAVNLYPFRETVARRGVERAEAVEQIDVGGPAMARAAAKNHARVAVLVDPADYPAAITHVRSGGPFPRDWLADLARKAFRHTANYDAAIADYLDAGEEDALPERIDLRLDRVQTLRYGENPHQRGALYRLDGAGGGFSLCDAERLGGKELSFNNLLDAAAAAELANDLEGVGCAIIKHTNPCGVGLGGSPAAAYERALACDPVSAFGSVIGCNRKVDAETARAMRELFVEAVVAPDSTKRRSPSCVRGKTSESCAFGGWAPPRRRGATCARFPAAFSCRSATASRTRSFAGRLVTPRAPSEEEERALRIAWRAARHVKSNAVVLADASGSVGVGAGQMSRVDAVRLAAERAVLPTGGCALGSDAFFPFRDGVDAAASCGVKAIAQPGGSVRDEEVIEAAAGHDVAMVFTGRRHFRH